MSHITFREYDFGWVQKGKGILDHTYFAPTIMTYYDHWQEKGTNTALTNNFWIHTIVFFVVKNNVPVWSPSHWFVGFWSGAALACLLVKMFVFGLLWSQSRKSSANTSEMFWACQPPRISPTISCTSPRVDWWTSRPNPEKIPSWQPQCHSQVKTCSIFSKKMAAASSRILKMWVCLKMGYTPNYSHLVGIMIINHWV